MGDAQHTAVSRAAPVLWTSPDPLPTGDVFQQYVAELLRWTQAHQGRPPAAGRCGVKQYMALHECLSHVAPVTDWWPVSVPFATIPLQVDDTLPDWGYTFAAAGRPAPESTA